MIKNLQTILLVFMLLTAIPASTEASTEASVASDALAKARAAMQSAFQLSFLHKLPVVFYKDSFDRMFAHANRSIDEVNLQHEGRTITRSDFQDDKALHIKKSAELALHIKSLIGSAHLAYGITMVIGLVKEAIDGSFLNLYGSRSKEDVYADHVGARAVFGEKKFDASLNKHLTHFVKPAVTATGTAAAVQTPATDARATEPVQINPFAADKPLAIGNTSDARQQLLKRYYEAAEKGDAEQLKLLGAELQKQP